MLCKAALTALALCLCLGLCTGCSDKNKTEDNIERAGHSVQKAYDSTTNVIKDVVEEVNDAVYD